MSLSHSFGIPSLPVIVLMRLSQRMAFLKWQRMSCSFTPPISKHSLLKRVMKSSRPSPSLRQMSSTSAVSPW
ncbi:hypothetical protein Hanom_Chr01g00041461 [Helianthus anomalus]